jgi:hypothetical protein
MMASFKEENIKGTEWTQMKYFSNAKGQQAFDHSPTHE